MEAKIKGQNRINLQTGQSYSAKQSTLKKFRNIDIFGRKINLTWKGKEYFKTTLGAIITMIVIGSMTGYTIYRSYYMINRYNPNINKNSLIRDVGVSAFHPQNYGFDFAFSLNANLDPSYGFYTVKYIDQQLVNTTKVKNKYDLSTETCAGKHFTQFSEIYSRDLGVDQMLCLQNTSSYELQGNYYNNKFSYIEIKLWKCTASTIKGTAYANVTCKDPDVIDAYISKLTFSFVFINSYFDVGDFESPIKQYIDDSLFFEMDSTKCKKANMYVQQSKASVADSLFYVGSYQDMIFESVHNIWAYDDNYDAADGTYVKMFIRYDKSYDTYERKVVDMLNILGDIGGLSNTLKTLGLFLVWYATNSIYTSKIVKKIYQIRKEQKKPKNKKKLDVFEEDDSSIDPECNSSSRQNQSVKRLNPSTFRRKKNGKNDESDIRMKEIEAASRFSHRSRVEAEDIQKILLPVQNRKNLVYSVRDLLMYSLNCLYARKLHNLSHNNNFYRKQYLFKKAERKLLLDLDIVQILQNIRNSKMLSEAMVPEKFRVLLKYQKQNLIETDSSGDQGNLNDSITKVNSRNKHERSQGRENIKALIKSIESKTLSFKERNLVRGMFERNIKDAVPEKKGDKHNLSKIHEKPTSSRMKEKHNKTKEVVMGISPVEKFHMSSIMDQSNFLDDAKR